MLFDKSKRSQKNIFKVIKLAMTQDYFIDSLILRFKMIDALLMNRLWLQVDTNIL